MVQNARVAIRVVMRALACVLLVVLASGCDKLKKLFFKDPPAILPISPNEGGEWLHTERNRLLLSDGTAFHGRGANIQDTRSCDACSYEPPHLEEVLRRVDELTGPWHATFLRLTLETYASADKRDTWQSVLEDEEYRKDLTLIVKHISDKPGVYVEISIWHDPSLDKMGWPTDKTRAEWAKLVEMFKTSPRVLFGVVNEPEYNEDGAQDPFAWNAMNQTVEAIRTAEGAGPHHIVAVQGLGMWSRRLDYYVTHPITAGSGFDIVYESHTYGGKADIDALLDGPAKNLPVIISEFGPVGVEHLAHMELPDCTYLMDRAEKQEVPYAAWTFHMRCPPSLLVDKSNNSCGVGMPLEPTPWGQLLKDRLAKPYGGH
jgi:endoglucanase